MSAIFALPTDVLLEVFRLLDPKDVAAFLAVCACTFAALTPRFDGGFVDVPNTLEPMELQGHLDCAIDPADLVPSFDRPIT